MEKHPRFSVIVPVYNRIDEVSDLMESLEAQTCKDFVEAVKALAGTDLQGF